MRELGFAIPVGARRVVPYVHGLVSDAESALPQVLRPVFAEAAREIGELEARIRDVEQQLERLAGGSALITRLRTIPREARIFLRVGRALFSLALSNY